MAGKPPSMRRFLIVAITVLMALPALAQRGDRRFGFRGFPTTGNSVDYDGRIVIVRLWYPRYAGWSYDYPDMEENFTIILKDITSLRMHPDGSNVFRMDDPGLLQFPIAYLSEPGYW